MVKINEEQIFPFLDSHSSFAFMLPQVHVVVSHSTTIQNLFPSRKNKLYGYKVTKISAVWVTAITYLVWKVEELGLYFTTIQFFFLPTEKISMVRKKTKLSSLEDKQLPTFTTKEGSVTCVLTPYNFFIAPKKKFYGWTSTKSFEAWKKQLTISRKLITEFF